MNLFSSIAAHKASSGSKRKLLILATLSVALLLAAVQAESAARKGWNALKGKIGSTKPQQIATKKKDDKSGSNTEEGKSGGAKDGSGSFKKNSKAMKNSFNKMLKNDNLDINDASLLHKATFGMMSPTQTKKQKASAPKYSTKSAQLKSGPVRDMRKYFQQIETENGTYYGPLDSKGRFCGTGIFYSKMASTYYVGGWCEGKKNGIGYTIKASPGIKYMYFADFFADGIPLPKAIYVPKNYERMFSGMTHCARPFMYLKCILTKLPEYGCPMSAVLAPSKKQVEQKLKLSMNAILQKTASLFNVSLPKLSFGKHGKFPAPGSAFKPFGISNKKGGFNFAAPMSGFGNFKPSLAPSSSEKQTGKDSGKPSKKGSSPSKKNQKSKYGGQESHSSDNSDDSNAGKNKGKGSQKGWPSSKAKPSKYDKSGNKLKKGDKGSDESSSSDSGKPLYKSSKDTSNFKGSAGKLNSMFGPINRNLIPGKFPVNLSKAQKKKLKNKMSKGDYLGHLDNNIKTCHLDRYCSGDLGYDANMEELVKNASNAANALKLKNRKFAVFECAWKGAAILMTISKSQHYFPGANVYEFNTNKMTVKYIGSGGEVPIEGALGRQFIVEVGTITDTHDRYMKVIAPDTEGKWAIFINDSTSKSLDGLKSHPVYFKDNSYMYKLLVNGECQQYQGTKIPSANQKTVALIGKMSPKLCPYLNTDGRSLTWPIIQGSSNYCNKPREGSVTFIPNKADNENTLMGTSKPHKSASCTYIMELKTHYINNIIAKLTGLRQYDSMLNPKKATIPREAISLLTPERCICKPRNHVALFKEKFPKYISDDEDETNCLVVPFIVNEIVDANFILFKLDPDIYLEMTLFDQDALSQTLHAIGSGYQAHTKFLPEHTYFAKIRSPKLKNLRLVFPGMESAQSKHFNDKVLLYMHQGGKELLSGLRDTSASIGDENYHYVVHPLGNVMRSDNRKGDGTVLLGTSDRTLCPYFNRKAGSITTYYTGSTYSSRDDKHPFAKVEFFCDADANSPQIDSMKRNKETFVHSFKIRTDVACKFLAPMTTSLDDCEIGKSKIPSYDKH